MIRPLAVLILSLPFLTVLPSPTFATDQGPRESTSPGTTPVSIQAGPPSAPSPIPGPLPHQKKVPTTASPSPGTPPQEPVPAAPAQERIVEIERQLNGSKRLSRKERRKLEQELADLKVNSLVHPATPSDHE